jgi:DNA-binding MarR family transcriptional regulator
VSVDKGAQVETDSRLAAPDLRMAVTRLSRRLRRERQEDNLTLNQLAVLVTLDASGPSTLGELAAIERLSAPSMTRIVQPLVTAGLVRREARDSDARQVVVHLTDSGAELLMSAYERRDRWLAERLDDLTPSERRVLREAMPLLERLARS